MYEYYYRNRPPGISCQPDGFDAESRQAWIPRRKIDGILYHGTVSYPEPMSYYQMWHYDLRAVDPVEYAEFIFWVDAHQSGRDWLREMYLDMDRDVLEEDASHDIYAQAALIILDAQEESESASP